MWIQNSYHNDRSPGVLYLVPTPIGNLEDITYRALNILQTVKFVAAEDTRQTLKLFRHFQIEQRLESYHEHNKHKKGEQLLQRLLTGDSLALVTDAGLPAVSDPGEDLVKLCVQNEIPVIPLPGANAALPGLIASGLSTEHFTFYGFLPRKKKERRAELEQMTTFTYTFIVYESPYRLKTTLKDLYEYLGDRDAAVVRELTKRYETFIRGTLSELAGWAEQQEEIKGECMVMVAGGSTHPAESQDDQWWVSLSLENHVLHYVQIKGMSQKDAIKTVALERGLPKRDVYNTYHKN
ncbi:16S rRNA (cytidine(1402)-2'-O)-methyltransferase [Tuberibacillus sp. Marseille-P3662]|uniref:16S rRNA (cytidine(1402)-2'-O)-methyltransferase n=1 Tax=Tuberibacillus sp. Marseille-P3662 TaxID=1965358 RepID=UPI000A1CBB07|nr:16S rRNA (cytidine(1402)-2'-O)-methyltransferase [Tuberibacillus sp. Marseille-P3662]